MNQGGIKMNNELYRLVDRSFVYHIVLTHRYSCSKWKNNEFCMNCFGGGLHEFGGDLLKECCRDKELEEGIISILTRLPVKADRNHKTYRKITEKEFNELLDLCKSSGQVSKGFSSSPVFMPVPDEQTGEDVQRDFKKVASSSPVQNPCKNCESMMKRRITGYCICGNVIQEEDLIKSSPVQIQSKKDLLLSGTIPVQSSNGIYCKTHKLHLEKEAITEHIESFNHCELIEDSSLTKEPFKEIVGDVEHLTIEEWRKKHPYFYAWLINNGFRYDARYDEGLKKKSLSLHIDGCTCVPDIQKNGGLLHKSHCKLSNFGRRESLPVKNISLFCACGYKAKNLKDLENHHKKESSKKKKGGKMTYDEAMKKWFPKDEKEKCRCGEDVLFPMNGSNKCRRCGGKL